MKIIRLLLLILLLLVVVVAVGGFLVYSDTMRGPLPQTSGSLNVSGLDAQVEILRDELGRPTHLRQHQPRPVFHAGLRSGAGSLVADGILSTFWQRID